MCNGKFIALAKELIANYYKEKLGETSVTPDQIGVVWISKVLQNNKGIFACFGTKDQFMFEVTRNGDKCETYIDVYDKMENIVIPM
jgi:hypothetical protein